MAETSKVTEKKTNKKCNMASTSSVARRKGSSRGLVEGLMVAGMKDERDEWTDFINGLV